MLLKCEKSKDINEKIKFLTNALKFSSSEKYDSILRKRKDAFLEAGCPKFAVNDLTAVNDKKDDEISRIKESCENAIGDLLIENSTSNFKRHQLLKNLSEKIDVKKEAGRGRFLVAKKDINPGEIIAVETSYAAVLGRNKSKINIKQ